MNLSLGERPVCWPVRTTSGPSAASVPSPARIARSYSSATGRLARTLPPMAVGGTGLVRVTAGTSAGARARHAREVLVTGRAWRARGGPGSRLPQSRLRFSFGAFYRVAQPGRRGRWHPGRAGRSVDRSPPWGVIRVPAIVPNPDGLKGRRLASNFIGSPSVPQEPRPGSAGSAEVVAIGHLAVLDASPNAIVAVDADGRIIYANPQAARPSAIEPGELARTHGRGPRSRIGSPRATPPVAPRSWPGPTARPMGIGPGPRRAAARTGAEFPVEISLAPVDTADGPPGLRHDRRHHRPQDRRGAAAPGPEAGVDRAAGRRDRPRLQQHAVRDPRLRGDARGGPRRPRCAPALDPDLALANAGRHHRTSSSGRPCSRRSCSRSAGAGIVTPAGPRAQRGHRGPGADAAAAHRRAGPAGRSRSTTTRAASASIRASSTRSWSTSSSTPATRCPTAAG